MVSPTKHLLFLLLVLVVAPLATATLPKVIKYDVDFAADGGGQPIGPRFWESTGWCPPDPLNDVSGGFAEFFVNESTVQNHIMIASVPRRGIRVVRIHFLLALLKYNKTGLSRFPDQFHPATDFDFTALDRGLDMLVGLNLSVVFEFMGNPGQENSGSGAGGLFTDLSNASELRVWRDIARAVAVRYIDRYGIAVVAEWEWQGWNEPDEHCNDEERLKAGIKCNAQSYVQWHFALAEGLRLASPLTHLLFGGPNSGGSTLKDGVVSPILQALLSYAVEHNSTHGLDFINWHHKGHDTAQIVADGDIEIINYIAQSFPSLRDVPTQNDEGDPEGGWDKMDDWRGDARYPAIAASILDQHLQQIVFRRSSKLHNSHAQFRRNSNDNGFLNYGSPEHVFRQRTLVARFMMNETSTVEVVRKPILNLMGLLSHLGSQYHQAQLVSLPAIAEADGQIGILSSSTSLSRRPLATNVADIAVLLYHANETSNCSDFRTNLPKVDLRLRHVGLDSQASHTGGLQPMAMTYLIDNSVGHNPLANWTSMGSPTYPSSEEFAQLRASADLQVLSPPHPVQVVDGEISVRFKLPCPAVLLYHVCAPVGIAADAPPPPTRIRLRVTPTRSPAEVLVFWEGSSSTCILTYEVLFAESRGSPMSRVNIGDSFFSAFVHAQQRHNAVGCYQVRAVDYWGRQSAPSAVACVNGSSDEAYVV